MVRAVSDEGEIDVNEEYHRYWSTTRGLSTRVDALIGAAAGAPGQGAASADAKAVVAKIVTDQQAQIITMQSILASL